MILKNPCKNVKALLQVMNFSSIFKIEMEGEKALI